MTETPGEGEDEDMEDIGETRSGGETKIAGEEGEVGGGVSKRPPIGSGKPQQPLIFVHVILAKIQACARPRRSDQGYPGG